MFLMALIDYTKIDFTKTGDTYDIVFDAVGKSSFLQCKKALSPAGLYLSTIPTVTLMMHTAMLKRDIKKEVW